MKTLNDYTDCELDAMTVEKRDEIWGQEQKERRERIATAILAAWSTFPGKMETNETLVHDAVERADTLIAELDKPRPKP